MKKFNDWLAVKISDNVGTMYAAYLFAVIGISGVVGAFTGNAQLVLIVGSISGYFLQLVLLPIIMVAGKIQSDKTIHHVKKHLDAHTKVMQDHHDAMMKAIKEPKSGKAKSVQ